MSGASDGLGSSVPGAAEPGGTGRRRNGVALAIVVAFLVLLGAKLATDGASVPGSHTPEPGERDASITSARNDAVADFEKATASGKPIYVLFHSLTCQPCVEVSAVADKVVPEYGDRIAFVNAIADDRSGQALARRFSFQYIPTSFFLAPGGSTVVDGFTGAMDEAQMRAYLDALLEAE